MEGVLETQELKLPQGAIKGAKRSTIYDDLYYSFEGIPYAKPPLGELRFKAPQPAEPWTETLDCTMYRSKPKQKNVLKQQVEGSEDCLYLNVYAKNLKTNKPLPVMVWIYGGGFYMGEATRELYSPDYFMHEDVIFVNFNYRLCSLGFLSLKDPSLGIPGNAGLKDQVAALKWVKQNIKHFNGDPENITVFGESAGGASTHYMMLTEQTRGLFQRAIPMSGCALNFWANMPQTDMPYRLAKYHGYTGDNNDKAVLAYLQTLPAEKLVQHELLNDEDTRDGYLFSFGPIIEPYIGDDCVLPCSPLELLKTAWSNSIPIMIGGTADEGLLMYPRLKLNPKGLNAFKTDVQRLLPREVRRMHTEADNQNLCEKLKQLHFGEREPGEECFNQFLDFYSYSLFWHGFQRVILGRLKYAEKSPTFLYRFAFDSPDFNLYRKLFVGTDDVRGVCHADDLCYLFFFKDSRKLDTNSLEFKTIRRMISLWTSFAKQADPNCEAIAPIKWQPLTAADPYHALNISDEVKIMELPEKQKLEAWLKLYKSDKLC